MSSDKATTVRTCAADRVAGSYERKAGRMSGNAANVRVLEIPPNREGLAPGTWFRWTELEAWLRAEGHDDVADALNPDRNETISERKVVLRRA